ncbi:MAG: hypothetical protein GKS05_03375 [Nitrospirales bacterium]|nr:hypothetical protein [Nitrospirales bacterium]
MTRLFLILSTTILIFSELTLGQAATDPSLQDLLHHIETGYSQMKDFQADFTQETMIEGFDMPLKSSGRVSIKKPGLLRWDYLKPSVEHMYVNGDHIKMFTPEYNQVIQGSLTRIVATQAPLRLLQGIGKLSEHFDVQPTGDDELGTGGLPLLTLIPKNAPGAKPSLVHKMIADIQPQTYFIQSLTLHETTGNVSTFRFSDIQANIGLNGHMFEFVPPEGVVVVDDVLP